MPRRSTNRFNAHTVEESEPGEKRYQIRDAANPGLILRVMPTGTKTWMIALDRNTIRKIGDAEQLTLKTAWNKAKGMMGKHARGELIESNRDGNQTLKKYLESKYQPFAEVDQKTGAANVARLLSACELLLETRVDKLSEFQIEKWKATRLNIAKPTTVKRDLAALKTALNKAVRWGLIDSSPASHVRVKVPTESRVRYLSDSERKMLLKALSSRDKKKAKARASGIAHNITRGRKTLSEIKGYADYLTPLVLLTMNTGMRRGEVLSLEWNQVVLGQNARATVRAGYSKSNKTRHIPLNSTAVKVVKKWKAQGKGRGLVFPNPVTGERMEKLKTSWPNLMRDAEIHNFRFHDLRHDFASRLVMAGTDLYRVKELLGHGSIEMTERYAHLAPEALAEAVEAIA